MPTIKKLMNTTAILSNSEIARLDRSSLITASTLNIFAVRLEATEAVSLAALSHRRRDFEYFDCAFNPCNGTLWRILISWLAEQEAINEQR